MKSFLKLRSTQRGLFSGFFDRCEIENEYKSLLDSVGCLAKVGAEYGQYNGFLMIVKCLENQVIIVLKVEFGDHLKWLRRNPNCFLPSLQSRGLTKSEFDFFMESISVRSKDENNDVGEAKIEEYIKNKKHSRAIYEVLKNRLSNIEHTTYSTEEIIGEYTIFLYGE